MTRTCSTLRPWRNKDAEGAGHGVDLSLAGDEHETLGGALAEGAGDRPGWGFWIWGACVGEGESRVGLGVAVTLDQRMVARSTEVQAGGWRVSSTSPPYADGEGRQSAER